MEDPTRSCRPTIGHGEEAPGWTESSEDAEPTSEALRRRLDALERDALRSHVRVLRDELGRALFMSVLHDCRNALDGEVVGTTVRDVAETLDMLTGVLVRGEIKGLRARGSTAG